MRRMMMRGRKVGYGSFVPLCTLFALTAGTFVPFSCGHTSDPIDAGRYG